MYLKCIANPVRVFGEFGMQYRLRALPAMPEPAFQSPDTRLVHFVKVVTCR